MQVSYRDATFVVSFTDNYDDEDAGVGFGGSFEVNRKAYAELYEACPFEQYSAEVPEWDEDEHDEDEELYVSATDDFIVFANAAGIEGGTWEITYNGAAYWFFHDLSHAEFDVSGGAVTIDPYGNDENRALADGAQRAFEHGVSLADIFREMALAETAFGARFEGHEAEGIQRFAAYLDSRLRGGRMLCENSLTTVAV